MKLYVKPDGKQTKDGGSIIGRFTSEAVKPGGKETKDGGNRKIHN